MVRGLWLGFGGLVAVVLLVLVLPVPLPFAAEDPPTRYRALAVRTQAYTWKTLAYLDGAANCDAANFLTYRRDLQNTTIADHWYVALQVRADAAMVKLGEQGFRCNVEKAFPWMEMLWSPGHQGYAPRADLNGANPTLVDVYADDNAVIGLAFLDIARTTDNPTLRTAALAAADRAARYPLVAGLWDGEFGGGLWWTNQRDSLGEGKPAQSTALLAQVMAELYAETGNPTYRQHAVDALGWLDRALWDEHHELYAYSVVHPQADPTKTVQSPHYFGYDQAIIIEALLTMHRVEPGDGRYLARAQQVGRAVDRAFWHRELGGYTLEADNTDLYAAYGVWISEALLDLHAVDGDQFWVDRARANFDALEADFRQGNSGAYSRMAFPCIGDRVSLCERDERWGYDRNVYALTQAMMQRVAALLAATG
jgi:hypothetical protein